MSDLFAPHGDTYRFNRCLLGCSGYALPPKERCKTTINLGDEDGIINVLEEDVETAALRAKKRCPICETAMDAYLIDDKRKMHVCGNNPNCEGYLVEYGEFKVKGMMAQWLSAINVGLIWC